MEDIKAVRVTQAFISLACRNLVYVFPNCPPPVNTCKLASQEIIERQLFTGYLCFF